MGVIVTVRNPSPLTTSHPQSLLRRAISPHIMAENDSPAACAPQDILISDELHVQPTVYTLENELHWSPRHVSKMRTWSANMVRVLPVDGPHIHTSTFYQCPSIVRVQGVSLNTAPAAPAARAVLQRIQNSPQHCSSVLCFFQIL